MMTAQDYTRYTGTAFTTKFRTPGDAIRFSLNKHNCGKTKIIMLEDETFGVMQNSLANRFIAAGYEELTYGLEALSLIN